jgi:hypothetical protein
MFIDSLINHSGVQRIFSTGNASAVRVFLINPSTAGKEKQELIYIAPRIPPATVFLVQFGDMNLSVKMVVIVVQSICVRKGNEGPWKYQVAHLTRNKLQRILTLCQHNIKKFNEFCHQEISLNSWCEFWCELRCEFWCEFWCGDLLTRHQKCHQNRKNKAQSDDGSCPPSTSAAISASRLFRCPPPLNAVTKIRTPRRPMVINISGLRQLLDRIIIQTGTHTITAEQPAYPLPGDKDRDDWDQTASKTTNSLSGSNERGNNRSQIPS